MVGNHWIEGCVGPRASLDMVTRRKILALYSELELHHINISLCRLYVMLQSDKINNKLCGYNKLH